MENEILLATSDGFYYQGTPSQGSYTTSKDTTTSAYTSYEESDEILNKIEGAIGISQTILLVIILICCIKGIMSQQKSKKVEMEVVEEEKSSNVYISYYIFAVIFSVAYGCLEIIEGFLDKF